MTGNKKISLELFQCLYENKQIYTGLVETLGYIYWTPEEIYFARVPHPDAPFKFQYQEIRMWEQYLYRNTEIKTKTVYHPHIIPPEELKSFNAIMYYDYYDGVPPLPNDAIQRKDVAIGKSAEKEGTNVFREGVDALNDLGDKANKPMLAADLLNVDNVVTKGMDKVFTAASIVSIFIDVYDGEYVTAANKAVDAAIGGWYGVALEGMKMYYNSDHFITTQYYSKFNELLDVRRRTKDVDKLNKATKAYSEAYERYWELMDSKRKLR